MYLISNETHNLFRFQKHIYAVHASVLAFIRKNIIEQITISYNSTGILRHIAKLSFYLTNYTNFVISSDIVDFLFNLNKNVPKFSNHMIFVPNPVLKFNLFTCKMRCSAILLKSIFLHINFIKFLCLLKVLVTVK